MATVKYCCMNSACVNIFETDEMTLEEHAVSNWRVCPKCKASAKAVSANVLGLGTCYPPDLKSGIRVDNGKHL